MGKYSLENYERYKMTKCRPEEDRTDRPGAGINTFRTVPVLPENWPELTENTLLKVKVAEREETFAETEAAIRKLASRYYQDPAVAGVIPETDFTGDRKYRLLETVAEAFAPKRCFVPVSDGDMLDYAVKHGIAGGLLIKVGENPYDCCEILAENNAQRLYRQMPVFVSFDKAKEKNDRYAQQWHASAVENSASPAGYRIALRRLNYPEVLSSGGFAPMQFWWTNRGPAFCHERTKVMLRLTQNRKTVSEFATGEEIEKVHLADRVYNRIIRLPEVPAGEYDLEYGVFDMNGKPIVMANKGAVSDGYYYAGELRIDTAARPEYEHIWDGYDMDGYYPLEDPAQPGD